MTWETDDERAMAEGIAEFLVKVANLEGKPETFEKLTFGELSYRLKRIGEVTAESRDRSKHPSLRARRNLFLMRWPNPYNPHHWATALALQGQNEAVEVQDKLARALVEALPELVDCVDPELTHDSPAIPSEAEGDPPMLAWDARAASYLEGLGELGARYASALRVKAAERWRAYLETDDEAPLWSWWNGLTEGGETIRFMLALATVLWHDRVRPQLEAPTLQPITTDGMAKVPKVVAPVSWAWGGGCLEAGDCLEAIVQDGERYGVAPELARDIAEGVALLPKSHPLITGGWRKRPHQSSLPLGLGQGEQPLPVAMTEASAGGLLSPLASKLMLLAMADPRVLGGGLVRVTVDELARALYPNAQRIQPPARNRVVEAAEEMGGLHIYNPEALNMPRVFEVTARVARRPDGSPEPDAQIWLGFSKAFERAWPDFTRGRYAGEFLVNLTGALGLDNRKPQLLRHYIRACAAWNASYLPGTDGRFNPAALPAFKPEDWGAMVNTLSPSAVEYLQGQTGARKGGTTARKATSNARKLVMNDLECLAEQHGLIRLERAERGKFKPLPPEGYIEAWERIRKAGRRPKG
jgi:hypothetical protein